MFQPSTPAQWTDAEPRASHEEPRELTLVRDVSQLLAEQPDLRSAFKQVVQSLAGQSRLGIVGAMVLVPGERGDQAEICVAEGSTLQRARGPVAPDAVSVAGHVRPGVV